jgi:Domain of unknown function (DUF1993)
MATSLYDLSVPTFLQTVKAVGGFLDRAARHCAETGADPNDFVLARLFDDMAPFHPCREEASCSCPRWANYDPKQTHVRGRRGNAKVQGLGRSGIGLSQSITCHPPRAVRGVLLRLIPSSGHGACLIEHLRQLLALLLGGPLTCDAMLIRPLIRICVPRREHLVVMAGDLGHRNRRCPAHAPATLANLIWSFHLTTF